MVYLIASYFHTSLVLNLCVSDRCDETSIQLQMLARKKYIHG